MAEKKTANKKKNGKKGKKKLKKKKKVETITKVGGSSAPVVCEQKFAIVSIKVGKEPEQVLKKKILGYVEIPLDVPKSMVQVPLRGTFNMGDYSSLQVGVDLSGITIDNPKARKARFLELLQEGLVLLPMAAQATAQKLFNKDLEMGEEE